MSVWQLAAGLALAFLVGAVVDRWMIRRYLLTIVEDAFDRLIERHRRRVELDDGRVRHYRDRGAFDVEEAFWAALAALVAAVVVMAWTRSGL